MMMKVVAIIQARMGSTRLPGKVMLPIGGKSMLARVVTRVHRAQMIDEVVVATSTKAQDDPIVNECQTLSVPCFRGNEDDVLDRYYQCALQYEANVIVRITADCPMIDPEVIDQAIVTFLSKKADYASNGLQRTFPRGLDTEVMTIAALKKAWQEAKLNFQRVHVTPYIHRNPKEFRLEPILAGSDTSQYRWTVDTQEDLNLVRTIYARFGNADTFSWLDAVMLMKMDPNLAKINQHVEQKSMQAG
jgi:spore coat polysaccharide biosynthesis protein SpsF